MMSSKYSPFFLNDLPLTASDHTSPLFRRMLLDSVIAKQYICGHRKCTTIINDAVVPDCTYTLTDIVRRERFTLCLDGSNDVYSEKLFFLIVCFLEPSSCKLQL